MLSTYKSLGLKYMHMAGFVHRDISGGNCLWYNGQGKISDLEYAKLYEQLSEHDARTVSLTMIFSFQSTL